VSISVFDLFKIGIGPSSSHTVGPMRAAGMFVAGLARDGLLDRTAEVRAELFGSLGATGHGHGSPKAVLLGLEGFAPDEVDPDGVDGVLVRIRRTGRVRLLGTHEIAFSEDEHLVMHRRKRLPVHSNGMLFIARDAAGETLRERTYYSVGGGFVLEPPPEAEPAADTAATAPREAEESTAGPPGEAGSTATPGTTGGTGPARGAGAGTPRGRIVPDKTPVKYPFHTGEELLGHARATGLPISGIMLENETAYRSEREIRDGLLRIWQVMQECVERGSTREGVLPGGLKVRRRAAALRRQLESDEPAVDAGNGVEGSDPLEWVTLFALAVNEENAAGGRVVTAPTNGAAGIVPAVLHYYRRFVPGAGDDGVVRFLLTAAAIGLLFKENASISGAEVGCQGEVGSACSMAAGALAEVLGGTPEQVENAAEIGMEHNLGLTCDPVGGLVQIPCIERNAIASVKAITAARMALRGDGQHHVSLDKVIKTMRETGADMKIKYKETARGGLAVNVIEC
jgi:L-serine dehydratase